MGSNAPEQTDPCSLYHEGVIVHMKVIARRQSIDSHAAYKPCIHYPSGADQHCHYAVLKRCACLLPASEKRRIHARRCPPYSANVIMMRKLADIRMIPGHGQSLNGTTAGRQRLSYQGLLLPRDWRSSALRSSTEEEMIRKEVLSLVQVHAFSRTDSCSGE